MDADDWLSLFNVHAPDFIERGWGGARPVPSIALIFLLRLRASAACSFIAPLHRRAINASTTAKRFAVNFRSNIILSHIFCGLFEIAVTELLHVDNSTPMNRSGYK